MPNDIVYILRENIESEELIYSLRSVEANFPHRKVWFVGGQPKDLVPDIALPHKQTGENKWDFIRSSMWTVIKDERLTDDFFLFNDDFFVMKPFKKKKFVNYADKSLSWRIDELHKQYPWLNRYGRTLVKAREELKTLGCGEINFEVHMPMLFNKELALNSIYKCSSPQMRSVYGNINKVQFVQHDDVKVYDLESVPEDCDFLSTNDETFRNGKVGQFIKGVFPNPSRFETPTPKGVIDG